MTRKIMLVTFSLSESGSLGSSLLVVVVDTAAVVFRPVPCPSRSFPLAFALLST